MYPSLKGKKIFLTCRHVLKNLENGGFFWRWFWNPHYFVFGPIKTKQKYAWWWKWECAVDKAMCVCVYCILMKRNLVEKTKGIRMGWVRDNPPILLVFFRCHSMLFNQRQPSPGPCSVNGSSASIPATCYGGRLPWMELHNRRTLGFGLVRL